MVLLSFLFTHGTFLEQALLITDSHTISTSEASHPPSFPFLFLPFLPPTFFCLHSHSFMHDILLGISLPPRSFFSTSFLFTAVIANLPSISLLASSPPLHSLLSPCLAHFRSHSDGRIHIFLDSEVQVSSPFPLSILSFIIPSPPLCLFYMN